MLIEIPCLFKQTKCQSSTAESSEELALNIKPPQTYKNQNQSINLIELREAEKHLFF